MIDGARVLAIVPARSGSKGLPGKNVRPLGGKPLLAWPVAAARACPLIDRVVVSTDSAEYARIAQAYGANVPALRPAALAADTAPSSAAVIHMLDVLAQAGERFDYLVLLEPTSPLTEGTDVAAALRALTAQRDRADAIVGVSEMNTSHPAFAVLIEVDGRLAPYGAADFGNLSRRQDVPPVFALDGSLYASDVAVYRERLAFCHERTLAHRMPHYKSLEVDDLIDFLCIETILANLDAVRAAPAGATP
jgi:CMP-N,N'-diacetyllegionaminic acid synthase